MMRYDMLCYTLLCYAVCIILFYFYFYSISVRITPRKPEYESTFRITEFSDKSVRMFK